MPKKQVSRHTGPISAMGKSHSSQNATQHGLTAQRPSSVHEKEALERYVAELNRHYQPKSPIEKLQIERIAICKIKLDRLYALEQAQLDLAIAKFEREPDLVLDQIAAAKGVIRGMAKEFIQYGSITLPAKLNLVMLDRICQEIEQVILKGNKVSDDILIEHYPQLVSYLKNYDAVDLSANQGLLTKLEHVDRTITRAMSNGDGYLERLRPILNILERSNQLIDEKNQIPTESELELIKFLQEQEAQRNPKQRKQDVSALPETGDMKKVQFENHIQAFLTLRTRVRLAEQVYQHFQTTKALMTKTVSLPQSESDVLMRYQTTLERRLSTLLGELLHLQVKKEGVKLQLCKTKYHNLLINHNFINTNPKKFHLNQRSV